MNREKLRREQLRIWKIQPILEDMKMYSQSAEDLVYGTIMQESKDKAVRQYGYSDLVGGAFSKCQIEMDTYNFLWNYAKRKARSGNSRYMDFFNRYRNPNFTSEQNLIYFDAFAIMLCRLYYWTKPEPLPKREDFNTEIEYVYALGGYWKEYWNTKDGAGTIKEFVNNYFGG